MRNKIFILAALIFTLMLSGCITAKVVEKELVDQQISGNQGYIMGNAPYRGAAAEGGTRKFIKVDIELPPYKVEKESPESDKNVWGNQGYINEPQRSQPPKPVSIFPSRPSVSEEEEFIAPKKSSQITPKPAIGTYKVQKNDSLWKIAARPEVYGNGNKWKKIYEANKEKIKNPNKLRPGVVLVIPRD